MQCHAEAVSSVVGKNVAYLDKAALVSLGNLSNSTSKYASDPVLGIVGEGEHQVPVFLRAAGAHHCACLSNGDALVAGKHDKVER